MKKLRLLFLFSIITLGVAFALPTQNAYATDPDLSLSTFVADDPNDLDGIYSVGDTFVITFNTATNSTASGTMTNAEFLANFTASQSLGTVTGTWTTDTVLSLNVDTAGGSPSIGTLTVSVGTGANIASLDTSSLMIGTTGALTGDFGQTAPVLTTALANDPDNGDTVISDGDTVIFTFTNPTNSTVSGTMTAAEVTGNFTFASGDLGTGATGLWDTATQLTVTVGGGDADAAISDAITRPAGANIDDIGGCGLLYTTTISLTGDFGQTAPVLTTALANDPDNGDTVISDGDTVIFTFTNPTNSTVSGTMTAAEVTGNFTFASGDLGTGATGLWDTATQLTVTVGGGFTASTASSTGGGSGCADCIKPSITASFDQNEFPLKYDGVSYESSQLDSVHTAIIETGEEFKITLSVFENSGRDRIKHIDLLVNHFGSYVLNDHTETFVTYDTNSGFEITDPNNLIATAEIIQSISGNKDVFDFVVVFENEIPQSDVLIRLWDTYNNSLYLHLPDALIVEISEQSSDIVSIESEVSDTEPESEFIVPESIPEAPESIPEAPESIPEAPESIPEAPESIPEVEISPKTWTSGELSVLKAWGGYDVETASDLDVLSKFGIKGEKIPSYVKQLVTWILKDELSQEEFVNILQYLKREGILSNSVGKQSFDVKSQDDLEELTLKKEYIGDKIQFYENENELYAKANLGDLEDKINTLRSLANNAEIQNELISSNLEFATLTNPNDLIYQRDSEWQRNPNTITPFMESLMNNESALIAKAIIEYDKESLVPFINIVITNVYGVNTAITEKTSDYKQSDEQWWDKTKTEGVYIMSGSSSEEHTGLYTTEISISVNDIEGNFIGIIKAVVNFDKALLSE
ncbi:MAG: hypothetical protein HRO68_06775 [Nitrosopumilus sp.]|nr:hypothetical protein [Nitrosopumilus sp.]